MENLKKHFPFPASYKQLTMSSNSNTQQSRSVFHTELPTFHADVRDCMKKLNIYLEVFDQLCGAGDHAAEHYVKIFEGTPYLETAVRFCSIAKQINVCTAGELQQVKEEMKKCLQTLVHRLEKGDKNDMSEDNMQVLAKSMANLIQMQCQTFVSISKLLSAFTSQKDNADFISEQMKNEEKIQKTGADVRVEEQTNPMQSNESSVPKQSELSENDITKSSSSDKDASNKEFLQSSFEVPECPTETSSNDICLATDDELNSVIGLLSCSPRHVTASNQKMPIRRAVPASNIHVPAVTVIHTKMVNNDSYKAKDDNESGKDILNTLNVFGAMNSSTSWPAIPSLQHRASLPSTTTGLSMGNDAIQSKMLGIPSVWASGDLKLNNSWPRPKQQKQFRSDVNWSSCHDSKDSSSDESSNNGDSYFALALSADLAADIGTMQRRDSDGEEETPRAEQHDGLQLMKQKINQSFQLDPKSTNTWPPKQPWARQMTTNQMAAMMSGDPLIQSQVPMPVWNEPVAGQTQSPWNQPGTYPGMVDYSQLVPSTNSNIKLAVPQQPYHILPSMHQ